MALRGDTFQQLLTSGNEQDEIVACLNERSGSSVFVARSGALWRWSEGSLTALSTNRAFYPISPGSLCEDVQGRIWMVSQHEPAGGLLCFSAGRLESVSLSDVMVEAKVYALARDSNGIVCLGT